VQIDVRGGPGRSKGAPGAPGPPRPPNSRIFPLYLASPLRPFIGPQSAATQGDPDLGLPRSRAVVGGSLYTRTLAHLAELHGTPTVGFHVPAHGGGTKRGGQIKRKNRRFWSLGCRSRPRDPLRSTKPAPHINLHKKSAPETNSKAISRRFMPAHGGGTNGGAQIERENWILGVWAVPGGRETPQKGGALPPRLF